MQIKVYGNFQFCDNSANCCENGELAMLYDVPKSWKKWDCLFITAIELYENGGELFGWSWAKKATEEKQVAIETKVTE